MDAKRFFARIAASTTSAPVAKQAFVKAVTKLVMFVPAIFVPVVFGTAIAARRAVRGVFGDASNASGFGAKSVDCVVQTQTGTLKPM